MYDLTRYAARAQRRDTSQYYAVIHKATKQLKARGLVHIIRYERGQKGAMKHIYDLTELGRWTLLAQVGRLDLRRFANCQRQMSKYFDKWEFLESMHVTSLDGGR
jgi:DNA-binding PadR family transcriptional regulator